MFSPGHCMWGYKCYHLTLPTFIAVTTWCVRFSEVESKAKGDVACGRKTRCDGDYRPTFCACSMALFESLTSMSSQSRDPDPYWRRHWWAALYRTPGSTEFRDSFSITGASSRHQPQPRLWGGGRRGWSKKKTSAEQFVKVSANRRCLMSNET